MIQPASLTRLRVVATLCLVPLALVFLRAGWLQIVQVGDNARRAESQHLVRVWQPPHRGSVLDRNGTPLAYTMYNYSLIAEPALVVNPAKTARTLSSALGVSRRRMQRLLTSNRRQVYLERKVTPMLERVVDLTTLPGIRETTELKRVYPQGMALAHVLGFLDHSGVGRAGIEAEFEELLRGHPGWATELRDAHGQSFIALGAQNKPPAHGHDLELTIDATLQDVAASALERGVKRLGAKAGCFIAVDPRSGEILAMASYPTFNPGEVGDARPEALRNRPVVDPYEPGSTFKLVAAAAALSDKQLRATTPIHCEEGSHNFGSYTIRDHHPYGTLNFRDCFAVSSNIAFAKVGNLCGDRLYEVARMFGFGSPTGIGLPGESGGRLNHPKTWSKRSAATIAIGYEVMATPLQLVMAFAAVANDGVLLRPRLIRRVVDPSGRTVLKSKPETVRRVVSPAVAATLRSFMAEVVKDGGTAPDAALSWAAVGGKTGTTEKLVNGSYSRKRHYASFVGMAPLDDPKLVCFVMIDEPQGVDAYGGSAAAPVFHEVLEAAGRLPGAWLAPQYATLAVSPRGRVGLERMMPASLEAQAGKRGTLMGHVGDGVPDVRGYSLRRALRTLRAYGLGASISGTGVVAEQDPPPGTRSMGNVRLRCDEKGNRVVVSSERDALRAEHSGRTSRR